MFDEQVAMFFVDGGMIIYRDIIDIFKYLVTGEPDYQGKVVGINSHSMIQYVS